MNFTHRHAEPGGRRLRLGIAGPSRSGKTLSSLRIATGMASVIGKKVFFIDTDNEFALDYAGEFQFEHVDFPPPYTSERYREAIDYCVSQDAGIIVVDQISHEHSGEGGVLQRQEETATALAEKWKTSREKVNMAAWNQAKTIPHGALVSYITRVKQPMIFNFRAKDKIKMVGKEIVHMGWQPICTEQFDYEMTAMLMLPPNCKGYPDPQTSEIRGPLISAFNLSEQLDEDVGRRLAEWAIGAPDWRQAHRQAIAAAKVLADLQTAFTAADAAARAQKDPSARAEFVFLKEARKAAIAAETAQFVKELEAGPAGSAGSSASARPAP